MKFDPPQTTDYDGARFYESDKKTETEGPSVSKKKKSWWKFW